MYNVNLYSNNHNVNSSFSKQFYSPARNQITQYQKNFISHYQDQNRMNNNSFYTNAQTPYIFPIPKSRMSNFIQRTPSPPPYSRLIYTYKDNFTKLVYNHSPQNLNRLSRNMINQLSIQLNEAREKMMQAKIFDHKSFKDIYPEILVIDKFSHN